MRECTAANAQISDATGEMLAKFGADVQRLNRVAQIDVQVAPPFGVSCAQHSPIHLTHQLPPSITRIVAPSC